jgi:hypothetical protein
MLFAPARLTLKRSRRSRPLALAVKVVTATIAIVFE